MEVLSRCLPQDTYNGPRNGTDDVRGPLRVVLSVDRAQATNQFFCLANAAPTVGALGEVRFEVETGRHIETPQAVGVEAVLREMFHVGPRGVSWARGGVSLRENRVLELTICVPAREWPRQ